MKERSAFDLGVAGGGNIIIKRHRRRCIRGTTASGETAADQSDKTRAGRHVRAVETDVSGVFADNGRAEKSTDNTNPTTAVDETRRFFALFSRCFRGVVAVNRPANVRNATREDYDAIGSHA